MSISTKNGDSGFTGLFSGEQVSKDDLRVEAYGTLDELDAHLGEAKHLIHDVNLRHMLIDVQKDLYRVMAQLANKSKTTENPITEADAERLTGMVHDFEQRVGLKGFVIPGATVQSAKLDVCRTVARRAERRIVALSQREEVPAAILQYVNRLSDFFFIIARWIETKEGAITYVKN
jgi:ATP:cob(I)alamin adenosyltransferase